MLTPLSNSLPQAGERTNEKGNLESSGEGTNDRCASLSFFLADENATILLAQRLSAQLKPGMVIYLHGDLGAGKTTLVRGVLNSLGYSGRVKSPTYTLLETYVIAGLNFCHFDLYRMHNKEEWESAGFRDEYDGQNILIIEWPENAAGFLPPADMEIELNILKNGRRAEIRAQSKLGNECLMQL